VAQLPVELLRLGVSALPLRDPWTHLEAVTNERFQGDIREASLDDLFGELRRRKIAKHTMRDELDITDNSSESHRGSATQLRRTALFVLAILTFVVLMTIGWLAIYEKEIPDLLSGLAGSGIGAIAGILAGGDGNEAGSTNSPRPI
jgi:hypothetical protein